MSSPLRVLLIEDSADDALLILHELRRGGYEPEWLRVDTALDLRSALQQPDWDVITCDYVMPGFGALEALAVIGEVGCDAPVIIVSGEVGEEVATVALTNGAHDFVSKHHLTRLVPAIGRELRESEERRVRRLAETTALFQAQLLDAAGQAIIAVDPDGFIIYWNRCAESLYGWTTAEVADVKHLSPSHCLARIVTERALLPHEVCYRTAANGGRSDGQENQWCDAGGVSQSDRRTVRRRLKSREGVHPR